MEPSVTPNHRRVIGGGISWAEAVIPGLFSQFRGLRGDVEAARIAAFRVFVGKKSQLYLVAHGSVFRQN